MTIERVTRQRDAEYAAAIERARRWDGRTHCEIDGCAHFATMEHVTAHVERAKVANGYTPPARVGGSEWFR